MADNTVRGRFVWHELMTPNGEGAHDFYSKVLGWRTESWEQDPSYRMFAAPTGPLGASVEQRTGVPQWVPYIGTHDVDETVAAATRLGATVTSPPASLPNAGRYAVLVDPHGAAFGVHGSPQEPRPESRPEPGEFSWHELATNVDPETAFAFYSELFGWDALARHDMGPMGTYLIFGRDGVQTGGMMNKGEMGRPGPAYWVGYVSVDDLDAAVESAKSARGSLLAGPMDVPGGDRVAQLADPHGAFFALHMVVAKEDEPAGDATRERAAARSAGRRAEKAAKPAGRPARKAAKKPAKKAADKPVKKTAKKAVKKAKTVAKKGAKKAGKKAAKKTAQKTARKPAKRAKASARTPAKRTAKKAAKKTARRAMPARRGRGR
jgi:hypothetical protein